MNFSLTKILKKLLSFLFPISLYLKKRLKEFLKFFLFFVPASICRKLQLLLKFHKCAYSIYPCSTKLSRSMKRNSVRLLLKRVVKTSVIIFSIHLSVPLTSLICISQTDSYAFFPKSNSFNYWENSFQGNSRHILHLSEFPKYEQGNIGLQFFEMWCY